MTSRTHTESALSRALTRAADHIRRHVLEVAAAHGVNPPQAAILRHLDEPVPMGALADNLCVDASYVTGLVDRLERLGYVERRPSPTDRRVKHVVLTEMGRETKSALRAAFVEAADVFDRLNEAEQSELLRLLDKAFPESRL